VAEEHEGGLQSGDAEKGVAHDSGGYLTRFFKYIVEVHVAAQYQHDEQQAHTGRGGVDHAVEFHAGEKYHHDGRDGRNDKIAYERYGDRANIGTYGRPFEYIWIVDSSHLSNSGAPPRIRRAGRADGISDWMIPTSCMSKHTKPVSRLQTLGVL
jgi:hypothetical protein